MENAECKPKSEPKVSAPHYFNFLTLHIEMKSSTIRFLDQNTSPSRSHTHALNPQHPEAPIHQVAHSNQTEVLGTDQGNLETWPLSLAQLGLSTAAPTSCGSFSYREDQEMMRDCMGKVHHGASWVC